MTRLIERFRRVRARTEEIAAPLSAEDQLVQSMPSTSPTKWHRAHTTWFFETFVLLPRGMAPYDARWAELFNSYYEAVGPRHARPKRGVLSRPSIEEIAAYRAAVDARVVDLLGSHRGSDTSLASIVRLGIAHEEQHQELMLTDILHAFSENPLRPRYRARDVAAPPSAPMRFVAHEGGVREIGATDGFAFDNETPRHRVWIDPFAIADRLVTIGEMKAFIRERGYETASLWLSDGWDFVRTNGIRAPLYAKIDGGAYTVFGLEGTREAHDTETLAHVSYYEADAIARFMGARLPTEAEWEASPLFADAWQWTQSAYAQYPGFRPLAGALGEYNGKFMANQFVLRGGSRFTPPDHVTASYRNFWPPDTRFQATGVRLAKHVR